MVAVILVSLFFYDLKYYNRKYSKRRKTAEEKLSNLPSHGCDGNGSQAQQVEGAHRRDLGVSKKEANGSLRPEDQVSRGSKWFS